MAEIGQILATLDTLPPEEIEIIYQHILQRRQAKYWLISGHQLHHLQEIMRPVQEESLSMSDEEIDAAIDAALHEVRSERRDYIDRRD